MAKLGYSCTLETKLIRRNHKITFRAGISAKSLINLLTKVPESSTVIEVIDDIDGDGWVSSIEFIDEVKDTN